MKVPLKVGQTLVIAFRTPMRDYARAGAYIYDGNGVLLTGELIQGASGIKTTKMRAARSGDFFFSIGTLHTGFGNAPGTVYRICVW